MPAAIIGAAASGGLSFATGTTFFGLGIGETAFLVAGAQLATSLAVQALGQSSVPDAGVGSFSGQVGKRSFIARSTIDPRPYIYGEVLVAGPLTLYATTGGGNDELYVVVPHADHPCTEIVRWRINEDAIGTIGDDDFVKDGRFADLVRVQAHLGDFAQEASADLVNDVPEWTSDHKGGGITYTALRLGYSPDKWPNGLTNIKAVIRGQRLYDPRDSGTAITTSTAGSPAVFNTSGAHGLAVDDYVWLKGHTGATRPVTAGRALPDVDKEYQVVTVPTASSLTLVDPDGLAVNTTADGSGGTVTLMKWSDNWALVVRHVLCHERAGMHASNDEINDTNIAAQANICDEQVPLTTVVREFTVDTVEETYTITASAATDLLTVDGYMGLVTGEPVKVAGAAVAPGGLTSGQTYYVIKTGQEAATELKLAINSSDAYALQSIDITGPGNGTFTVGGNTVSSVNDTSNRITMAGAHGWATGKSVVFAMASAVPAPLVAGTTYYAIRVSDTTFKLATSLANANAGTAIDLTDAGGGGLTVEDIGATARTNLVTSAEEASWKTGDVVRATTTNTLPDPLAVDTDYFIVKYSRSSYGLATSLANARARTLIDLTDAGTGTHELTRNSQLRYTCNGVVRAGGSPIGSLDELMTAAAGIVVWQEGTFLIYAGAATAQSGTIGDGDLATDTAPITGASRIGIPESFNAARGTFVDPDEYWTQQDLPPYTTSIYEVEDANQRIYKDFDFPFTTDVDAGQRLLKIALERVRQGATLTAALKPSKFATVVWDVEAVTIDELGYAGKLFRVMSVAEAPDHAIRITLREEAAAVWDWNLGDETTYDYAPDTGLPDGSTIGAPGVPAVTESLYETFPGAGVKAKATLTWTASAGPFLSAYYVEYQVVGAATWTTLAPTTELTQDVLDVAAGDYYFRARAVSSRNVNSDWATTTATEVAGLSAPPSALTNLSVTAISTIAQLQWTASTDLDVLIGGTIRFRHSPETSGASWQEAREIGTAVPGNATFTNLPLVTGTDFARPYDSIGTAGAASSISTTAARLLAFSTLGTVTEDPAFSGTHSSTIVISSALQLTGAVDIDDWVDVDEIQNWDWVGGVAAAGTYTFATGLDATTVKDQRVTTHLKSLVVDVTDTIDERSGLVDDWDDWDGTDAASADAQVWFAETDDDPTGAPVWSDWMGPIVALDVNNRAMKFQCRLTSADTSYNIQVTELRVTSEELA